MHRLDDALANEQRELDTVLLRLTTLRLLLASGKHRMVDQAIEELEAAMVAFEAAEAHSLAVLREAGHATVSEATVDADDETQVGLERRCAELRALHREVRVAMASTASATERSLRRAATVIDLADDVTPRRTDTRFFTEGA